MRLLRLARAALEAEGLYLRRLARARGLQAGFAAAALVFVAMVLLMLHVAAFAALVEQFDPAIAALLVALGDLVLAGVLALAARRAAHDPVAEEALRIREAALRQLGDGAARLAMLAPLVKGQAARKGLLGAAMTALAVGLMARR